jgi:hypothetical protein
VIALLLAACTADPPATSDCPDDLPEECPSPAPTWSADVAPIVARTCATCHDGAIQSPILQDRDTIFASRGPVLDQVYACLMPPPTSGLALDDDERAAFLGWLVCGAPDD